MWDLNGKLALVTGAASGIGRATAKELARKGARLVLCDVNDGGLNELAAELGGACVMVHVVDVSNAEAMRALAERVHGELGTLDVLVNNAGVGISSSVLNTTLEDWDWVMGVNLKGVVHGLHFFLPRMVERGQRGHVVNVASLAGYFVSSGLSAYLTTKFAVFGLSEVTREDLRGTGIGVSTICPGIIKTNIVATSRYRGVPDPGAVSTHIDAAYKKRNYGPDKVGAAIVNAIQHNRKVVPVSPESWALYYITRFNVPFSRWIGVQLVKNMMK